MNDNVYDRIFDKKRKPIIIGILGAPINNGNMGCVALTYALLTMLEKISADLNITFCYYIFEGVEDVKKNAILCQKLSIEEKKVKSFNIYPVESILGLCHRPYKVIETYSALKDCNLFIDLTQGDSFSDIYGNTVFIKNANGKRLIEKRIKKPLILGPQTFGPYQNLKNMKIAKKIVERADLVITRDVASTQYIKTFSDKKVYTTTDLAFNLPYKKDKLKNKNEKVKVGVNVSGLLSQNKLESTPTKFHLKTNYDEYIDTLLIWLIDNDYDVSFVPHVIADYECEKKVAKEFPQVKVIEMYENPIDIKSEISKFDIFIGGRMHATIGAFSSGVATIPTAYSRKFNGLYKNIGYSYVIDLLNLSTEESLERTKIYIENYSELKTAAMQGMKKINELENKTESLFREQIVKMMNELSEQGMRVL